MVWSGVGGLLVWITIQRSGEIESSLLRSTNCLSAWLSKRALHHHRSGELRCGGEHELAAYATPVPFQRAQSKQSLSVVMMNSLLPTRMAFLPTNGSLPLTRSPFT